MFHNNDDNNNHEFAVASREQRRRRKYRDHLEFPPAVPTNRPICIVPLHAKCMYNIFHVYVQYLPLIFSTLYSGKIAEIFNFWT